MFCPVIPGIPNYIIVLYSSKLPLLKCWNARTNSYWNRFEYMFFSRIVPIVSCEYHLVPMYKDCACARSIGFRWYNNNNNIIIIASCVRLLCLVFLYGFKKKFFHIFFFWPIGRRRVRLCYSLMVFRRDRANLPWKKTCIK